ncbi:MAG: formylmethanofuran dehydrogenase [Planctomycetota bacterium]|nr:MAG: formylmethanofuran dehydrogenase [Planctomycetota bacterium]
MAETFIIIPGRTSRQGTTLNEGKYTSGYREETGTLQMNPQDMQRLGLQDGDRVRVWNDHGSVVVPCKAARGDELPEGILFISYGDVSSRLMGGDTHGSGMPDSKGFDVFLEPVGQSTDAKDAVAGP